MSAKINELREERDKYQRIYYETATQLGLAEDALKEVQLYSEQAPCEYGRGVVDGHRCAAKIARDYFASRWNPAGLTPEQEETLKSLECHRDAV